ncbi:3-coathanger stack domain-containing protein, partial [Emticicia sp. W12TSBA100-4]|uniref:3-coathanger stack domain-containing protein n=1 Tax=Emticicia sp. W12TSBA100-4 TaxID=3160965 RepID=UPI0033058DE7
LINGLEIKAKPNAPTITPPTSLSVCSPSTLTLTADGCAGTVTWSEGAATGTSLTLSAVGTYSISATCTVNGCNSDQSLSITGLEIKASPIITATNTGPYKVGQIISLTGTGAVSYNWSGPNNFSSTLSNPTIPNALSVNGGVYSLSVIGVNGCSAVATTNVIVSGIDPCDPTRIVDYLYVQAGNPYQPLFPLTNGMVINQRTEQVSILVNPVCPSVTIESFEMNIQGPELNWNILQNVSPYALFDNFGNDVWGRNFKPGVYTLTLTGYAQDNKGGGITYGPKIITFTVVGDLATINAPTLSKTVICAGSNVDVSFTTTGTFNGVNQFQVELSDTSGSFAAPVLIGTTNTTGTLNCTIPQNTLEGSKYLIRVASTNQVVVSNPAMGLITVHPFSYTLINPDNNLTGTSTKKAVSTINASNKVISPTNVTYQAGNSILLTPGFESGAVFKAEIQGCNN